MGFLRAAAVAAVLLVLPAEGYHSDETLTLLAAKHQSKHTKHQKQKKVQPSKPSVTTIQTSVAHKTERYAALGATLKYLTAEEVGPDGKAGTKERK